MRFSIARAAPQATKLCFNCFVYKEFPSARTMMERGDTAPDSIQPQSRAPEWQCQTSYDRCPTIPYGCSLSRLEHDSPATSQDWPQCFRDFGGAGRAELLRI